MPSVEPLKTQGGVQASYPQSETDILPRLPVRALVLAPGGGGKTTMLTRLITDKRFYGGKFARIYWISPTATVDPGLDGLRDYVEKIQPQDSDPTFRDEFDPEQVQRIIDRAKQVTEHMKKSGDKRRFGTLIVLDDLADNPAAVHKCGGLLETLYVRGRHFGISTFVLAQKLKLISPCVRVNLTALFVFRLRNMGDLKAMVEEYSAVADPQKILEMYRRRVQRPFGFFYIDLVARDVNKMFFNSFLSRLIIDEDSQ